MREGNDKIERRPRKLPRYKFHAFHSRFCCKKKKKKKKEEEFLEGNARHEKATNLCYG